MTRDGYRASMTESASGRRSIPWEALAGTVQEITRKHPDLNVYALLDVRAEPDLQRFAAELADSNVALFDGTLRSAFGDYSPRLIAIPTNAFRSEPSSEAGGTTGRLLALARDHACVSWLLSALSSESLASHLRLWLDGLLLDDDGTPLGAVLIRYYDPRVLPGFMDILTPAQYGEFMRPIAVWGAWLRSNRWKTWEKPENNLPGFAAAVPRYSILQQQRLDASTRTDRLLARLREIARKDPDGADARAFESNLFSLTHELALRHLDQIIARGVKHGLQSDSDLVLYAGLALKVGLSFDQHADVYASIQRAARERVALAHTLSDVHDNVWSELAAAMNRPAPAMSGPD